MVMIEMVMTFTMVSKYFANTIDILSSFFVIYYLSFGGKKILRQIINNLIKKSIKQDCGLLVDFFIYL